MKVNHFIKEYTHICIYIYLDIYIWVSKIAKSILLTTFFNSYFNENTFRFNKNYIISIVIIISTNQL